MIISYFIFLIIRYCENNCNWEFSSVLDNILKNMDDQGMLDSQNQTQVCSYERYFIED
jgi:hypothetical protein